MQDSHIQKSPEFLDETKPERNERSLFERLLGKESDEERLRKKLDEELKEAARTRAEQFEEERRVEEQREVAETKKLKKRWRAKLFEKSQKMLLDAATNGDEPVDGVTIAKLMVAERIVRLYDMIQNDDLRRSEVKKLKIHIDFMGLLAEKLERPELEVPEEVEQLYVTIAASVAEVTGETPAPLPDATPTITPEIVPPLSEADAAYTQFAGSIVRAIRRVVSPLSSGRGGSSASQPSAHTPETIPQDTATQRMAYKLLAAVEGAALSSASIRKEISQADTIRRLSHVVERAAVTERAPALVEKKRPGIQATVEHLAAASLAHVDVVPPRPEKDLPQPHVDRVEQTERPSKKIKHMTELELMQLAKTITIGHGRLLSDVYLHGEIDKEGLIKVLESHRKGRDFRSEFMLRRDAWRRHREASPEYLTEAHAEQSAARAQPANKPATQPSSSQNATHTPAHAVTTRNIGRTATLPTSETRQAAKARLERQRRQSNAVILFVTMFLVIALLIVVINLNLR